MFKVDDKIIGNWAKVCSKLTGKVPEQRQLKSH